MEGHLFRFEHPDSNAPRVGFICGKNYENVLIFIGGLTDGFLSVPYLDHLSKRLLEKGWSLVQVILSSSYSGYGISSLEKDKTELISLIDHIIKNFGTKNIVLLGHSTGCQDIVHFLRGSPSPIVKKVILQGPVSDRDFMETLPNTKDGLARSQQYLKQGTPNRLLEYPEDHNIPITAYRFQSLVGRLTDDDMFSNDLTNDELGSLFAHIQIPCLLVFSMNDEYVPDFVDTRQLAGRLSSSIPKSNSLFLENANHVISDEQSKEHFMNTLLEFIAK